MKPSEQKLLVILITVLAIGGGVIGSSSLLAWQHRLDAAERKAELDQMESAALLARAEEFAARSKWLEVHQPVAASDREADELVQHEVIDRATASGIEVKNWQFVEPTVNESCLQAGVSMIVRGELAGVFRWLCAVQAPEKFFVVPDIKITPDKDDPGKVVCALQVLRWYRPLSSRNSST